MIEHFSKRLDEVREKLNVGGHWHETRTINHVIFPILKILGWNPENHNQIEEKRQIQVGTSNKEADIILKNSSGDALIIEAKAKNHRLNDDDAAQLNSYCSIESIAYGVLTNGRTWYLIDCTERKPVNVEAIHLESDEYSKIERVFRKFLAFDAVEHGDYLENFAALSRTKKLETAWADFVDSGDHSSLRKILVRSTGLSNSKTNRGFIDEFVKRKLQSTNSTTDNQVYSATDSKSSVTISGASKRVQRTSRSTNPPTTCKIFGNTVEIQSWRAILVEFVEAIGNRSSSDLVYLLNMENHWLVRQVDKRVKIQYRQIGNADIWLNVNLDRNGILRRCKSIQEALNINENDLIY